MRRVVREVAEAMKSEAARLGGCDITIVHGGKHPAVEFVLAGRTVRVGFSGTARTNHGGYQASYVGEVRRQARRILEAA